MKVAIKVVFGVVAGILIVLVGFGYVRVRREITLFDSDIRKDHRLIGSTLAISVHDTWMQAGRERAIRHIGLTDAGTPGLRITWVNADGSRAEPPVAVVGPDAKPPRALEHRLGRGSDGGEYLVTHVPVLDRETLFGSVEIAETLGPRDAYIRATIWNTVLATTATGIMAGLMALLFGIALIGRPLNQLAAKARRIGEGELAGPLVLSSRDEIGQLAVEMNAMCVRLTEANSRAADETAARLQALEQLRHADRLITVGKLAAGIAHELGTPLNVVSGRAKMLQRGQAAPETVRDYARVIVEQADRMTGIIRQLLDFARRREPRTASVDMAALAGSVSRLLAPMADKRSVAIVLRNEAVMVTADPVQLEQVVTNLLVNAIQASAEGSTVTVSTGLETTDAASGTPLAFVRVTDRGHGMDAETASRVFEPFFTTKDVGQGAGLGLSVAHGIVEGHGGSIDVQSAPGEGSVFTVYIPQEKT